MRGVRRRQTRGVRRCCAGKVPAFIHVAVSVLRDAVPMRLAVRVTVAFVRLRTDSVETARQRADSLPQRDGHACKCAIVCYVGVTPCAIPPVIASASSAPWDQSRALARGSAPAPSSCTGARCAHGCVHAPACR